MSIAFLLPGSDFVEEDLFVGDAAVSVVTGHEGPETGKV
jgi:hypothetical protein